MSTRQISKTTYRFPNKTTLNWWVDLAMFILAATTLGSAFVDTQLHIWLGLAVIPMLAIHVLLHWDLINALLKRLWQGKLRLRWKWLLDVALVVVFVPLILSGMVVALIYAPKVSRFHEVSVYVFALLVLIHLFTNRKWITHKINRGWKLIVK